MGFVATKVAEVVENIRSRIIGFEAKITPGDARGEESKSEYYYFHHTTRKLMVKEIPNVTKCNYVIFATASPLTAK